MGRLSPSTMRELRGRVDPKCAMLALFGAFACLLLFTALHPSQTLSKRPPPPEKPQGYYFISIGDWGTDNMYQQRVQVQVVKQTALFKPAFILGLGDNFYDEGVTSLQDRRFESTFESVYRASELQIPWYMTLGDHDHQGNVSAQILYTGISRRWYLPAPYYSRTFTFPGQATLTLIVVDSVGLEGKFASRGQRRFEEKLDPVFTDETAADRQIAWLREALSNASSSDWVVVAGHRPIMTGGQRDRTHTEDLTAAMLRDILIDGGAHMYLNGHDHTMQHIWDGKLNYFVNGGGGHQNLHPAHGLVDTRFASTFHGFCMHHVGKEELTTTFFDVNGRVRYKGYVKKDRTMG